MINSFKDLGLSEPILKALKDMEFQEPTEVQARAIPHVLNGKDVIVTSKTGSGKTAVFGVSVLQLTDPADQGPQCLILEPTRELAVQVDNDLRKMAKYVRHSSTAVYGQHNIRTEMRALEENVSFVTGTPGRVYDHIQQGNLKTKNIKYLVLDEVDRMMDMGFIDQVRRIIRTLPRKRVTLLFSATIPEEIARLCRQFMNDPVTIEIESDTRTVDTIEQRYYRVERNEKRTKLNRLLLTERPETCMIFCNTKIAVDQVQSFLTRKGYASRSLHGDIPQNKRMNNIQQFKKGSYNILVATDVAARGIHVEDLSLVINYDVPIELDSYVHRIGRTGRAGHDGRAISLVTSEDIMTIYAIEEHIGTMIPQADLPTNEELAAQKAESDAWVLANAIKTQPGKQFTGSGSGSRNYKDSRNKPNRKKPYQRGGGQRQAQGSQPTGTPLVDSRPSQQVAGKQQTTSTERKTGSYNRNRNHSRNQHKPAVNAQQKNVTAASHRIDQPAAPKVDKAAPRLQDRPDSKAATRVEKNIPAKQTENKPLFKRVLSKIFGK